MLELLSLRKGTTLTKEMFLNHLYGGMDEPELKIIDVFICKLRKKLANASSGKNYIETVWGRGYVLREPSGGRSEDSGLTVSSETETMKTPAARPGFLFACGIRDRNSGKSLTSAVDRRPGAAPVSAAAQLPTAGGARSARRGRACRHDLEAVGRPTTVSAAPSTR